MNTLMNIMERTPEIAAPKYVELTLQNRKCIIHIPPIHEVRREKMPHKEYQDLVMQYIEQVEEVLESA
jgi:hypothetical protein